MMGRWSELPIGSASLQDVLADQLLSQRKMSGVLSVSKRSICNWRWNMRQIFERMK